eukprot:CAMPEP_0201569574 /NCGR_PEP_ID=MMETSP0190_2-20130828/11335_1 /ASSEMBLY_ACC=CAM_ASM_000263 /TAXON_ID=37353 /ORGANISM="Rosalina sp." /LENGTH=1378 /DNA_ID=CAMNT_0047992041 /DNA_START=313 /DNA_END=4446 /DNA_ORIENTATION=+
MGFGRLVIYSVNCIANISENKVNCERIVDCGGIQVMKEVMNRHSNNPAVMKEVARTLTNIAKSHPIHAKKIAESGLLQQCLKTLQSNPREVGTFAIQIMESVLKYSADPMNMTQQVIKNDGLLILENILKSHFNDSDLCSSVIQFMNTLMTINPTIAKQFGDKSIWNHVINSMKSNAKDGDVAVAGIKALQKLAALDKNYAISIQQVGAVEVISNCMQSNPDLKELTQSGAAALRLLAVQDDVSRALNLLLDFGKYDNVVISQALGLMGNLALIQENAQFIVTKGGLNCLMNLINYKCAMKDLSPEDVSIVANSVRAMGRLLEEPQNSKSFVNKGGLALLKDMLEHYDHEEVIMNAVIDALGNMVKNKQNQQISGSVPTINITNVICKHPEYNVLMQKFADLLTSMLSDNNQEVVQQLLKAGLLSGVQQSLIENCADPETVAAIMDIIKQIILAQPKLAQQIANENANGIYQAIRSNQNNPKVLAKILDTMHQIGKADANALTHLIKEAKLKDQLSKILKSEAVSDETAAVIRKFMEDLSSSSIDIDLQQVMIGLKGLGMSSNQLNKSITETEVKDDANGVINQVNVHSPLVAPDYSQQYIAQGTVGHTIGSVELGNPPYTVVESWNKNLNPMIGQGQTNYNPHIGDGTSIYEPSESKEATMSTMKGKTVPVNQTSAKVVGPPRIQGGDNDLFECDDFDAQTLFSKLRPDPRIPFDHGAMKSVTTRLQGGDQEIYNYVTTQGGLGMILGLANSNMGNPAPLNDALDAIGTLSSDDNLRTLLGMHGTVRLIIEVIRAHPNDIELLDKCCYILSNLSFNNAQNMTSIIELGGVKDIVDIIQTHDNVNFICESAVNVLVNLCHNSDKNKVLIARSGGAKAVVATLRKHNRCLNDGDAQLCVACFRCLANLAYVPDNVKQLVKLDTVAYLLDTMNQNTDKRDLIQMGVVCLANLSSHQRTAARMVNLGVLDLCIKVSQSYPDAMEIQRSCLGCIGNLMNEQSNAVTFLDKKGHLRVYEIMQELAFEESVVITALKLLKILATNTDTATEMALSGGCIAVAEIMEENKQNQTILSLGCQALCKMIVTMEAAKYIAKDGLCDIIVEIAKDNNNWANIQIMNELIKVIVNVSSVEENAQLIARNGAVPILRSIEAHKTNAVFLNNAARALSKMTVHPTSSRPLVKRGGVAVILQSMQANPTRKAILAIYIRALTNMLYTEHRTSEELGKNNGFQIVQKLVNQFPDYQPLQSEFRGFEKATKLGSNRFRPGVYQESKVRQNLDTSTLRFLGAGTVCKKYHVNGKAKKKVLKVNDDCSLLLFERTDFSRAPKQLNMKSIKNVVKGAQAPGMDKCNPNNAWVIISVDPNGREHRLGMECKTNLEMEKW